MSYKIEYKRTAQKYLDKLSGKIYRSITAAIEELAEEPRPNGAIPLQGYQNIYRIRKGELG